MSGDICAKGLSAATLVKIRSRYHSVSLSESDNGMISAVAWKDGMPESGIIIKGSFSLTTIASLGIWPHENLEGLAVSFE